jgi:hypothetical protein
MEDWCSLLGTKHSSDRAFLTRPFGRARCQHQYFLWVESSGCVVSMIFSVLHPRRKKKCKSHHRSGRVGPERFRYSRLSALFVVGAEIDWQSISGVAGSYRCLCIWQGSDSG